MFQEVLAGGATWDEDQLMILTRNHYVEETHMTVLLLVLILCPRYPLAFVDSFIQSSCSPVHLENGTVGGVLTTVSSFLS